MDQDIRTAFQKVRRCIARICFDRVKKKADYRYIIIPGIIVAVDDEGLATIVADPVCSDYDSFSVRFPTATGYEEPHIVLSTSVDKRGQFCTFNLRPRIDDFVRSVTIETRALKSGDYVDAFMFPRKGYITPAAYCKGGIMNGTQAMVSKVRVLFHECPFHEYAFLGSPIFNRNGDLVGITFADMGTLIAWTVWQLRDDVLKYLNGIFYVLDGPPTEQAPMQEE